ncbi:hypothetical protein CKO29_09345 [Allochromatium vinosum]|nr:hypothetical protein [Allochromatium vinosum]
MIPKLGPFETDTHPTDTSRRRRDSATLDRVARAFDARPDALNGHRRPLESNNPSKEGFALFTALRSAMILRKKDQCMRTVKATPLPAPLITHPQQLGALVRAVRTASGLTLEETALSVKVAKQTLQNLETGTGTVSLALAFKVMNGLGIRLTWQAPPDAGGPGGTDAA